MTSPDSPAPDRPAIAEGLFFRLGSEPALRGAECAECGCVTFPYQNSCPRCTASAMSELPLPRTGRLWSWTVQGFPPKSPPYASDIPFGPYGVGYIDLGVVLVESRLTEHRPSLLRIGMPMEVVTIAWGDRVSFAFAPVEENR